MAHLHRWLLLPVVHHCQCRLCSLRRFKNCLAIFVTSVVVFPRSTGIIGKNSEEQLVASRSCQTLGDGFILDSYRTTLLHRHMRSSTPTVVVASHISSTLWRDPLSLLTPSVVCTALHCTALHCVLFHCVDNTKRIGVSKID